MGDSDRHGVQGAVSTWMACEGREVWGGLEDERQGGGGGRVSEPEMTGSEDLVQDAKLHMRRSQVYT